MRTAIFSGAPLNDSALIFRAGKLASELKNLGHDVRVYSTDFNYKGNKTQDIEGVLVHFIGQAHYLAGSSFSDRKKLSSFRYGFEILRTLLRFKKEMRKFSPDIIHLFSNLPIASILYLNLKRKYKMFIDIDDLTLDQAKSAGVSKLNLKLVSYFAEKVPLKLKKISVCSYFLHNKFPNSVRIPNMVYPEKFSVSDEERDFLKKKYNLKKKVVIFQGAVGKYHGQLEFVDVIPEILNSFNDVSFLFVGGGINLKFLKDKIKELKLEHDVVCTGNLPQEDCIRLMIVSDIGVLPMWDDNVYKARNPLKLIEYLASGLSIVSSDVGDVSFILKHKKNGFLGRPGNLNNIKEGVLFFLSDDKLRRKVFKENKLLAKQFYVENVMKEWMRFYESDQ